MPVDLQVPRLALPDATHRGTTLGRLADPHEPGSPGAERDWSVTRSIVAQRTPAGDDWARAMDAHGGTSVWRELLAQADVDQQVAQHVLGAALHAASAQAGIGKQRWHRLRPFQQDLSLMVVGRTPKPVDTSYPSGHAARAYAGARVVATFDPALTDAAYAMAREVAVSRIYAGVHFASDVVAGARLGTGAAESVLSRWRAGVLPGIATAARDEGVAA
jgi:hypothetical protein